MHIMEDTDNVEKCPSCRSRMDREGYDGNWEVFVCKVCNIQKEIPVDKNPDKNDFTMESLIRASEYTDEKE